MKGLLLKDAYQIWHYAKGVIVAAVVRTMLFRMQQRAEVWNLE